MQLYSVDREGWVGIHDGLADAELLEWIDAANAEYLLIDSDGYLYEAHETGGSFHGYEWRRTGERRPEVLAVVTAYDDNTRLSPKDSAKCRSDIRIPDGDSWSR